MIAGGIGLFPGWSHRPEMIIGQLIPLGSPAERFEIIVRRQPELLIIVGENVICALAEPAADIAGTRHARAVRSLRRDQSAAIHVELVLLRLAAEHRVIAETHTRKRVV